MWRKNCVAAVPVHLRILLRSQGSLRCLSTHKSKRDFVSVRSERGRWRNESPAGGLTELYVYQDDNDIPAGYANTLAYEQFVQLDRRINLPGHVGVIAPDGVSEESPEGVEDVPENKAHRSDLLARPTRKENQAQVLYSAADYIQYTPGAEEHLCSDILQSFPSLVGMDNLICELHDAPLLLRKELSQLFPGRNMEAGSLSVITIATRTENDMSAWSDEMETERELLTEHYVAAAKEICARLKDDNYWADFIDPCSGKPYYGSHTPTTMFETDEKYRLLGFRIEDLGCCKVLCHKEYGRNVFVGTIFSDVGTKNGVVQDIFEDLRLVLSKTSTASGPAGIQMPTP